MANFGIKHTGSFICFVCPSMFQLSRVTRNYWLSLDDVYSHKLCPGETCAYMFYKEYVSPYHGHEFDFRSCNSFCIHLNASFLARRRLHLGIYRRFKFLVSLCMDIPQTFAAVKHPIFIKLNSRLTCLSYWGM